MTNLKPGPLTADMVPLLTAGRSVLVHTGRWIGTVVETFDGPPGVTINVFAATNAPNASREQTGVEVGFDMSRYHISFYAYIGERGDDGWIHAPEGGWPENPVPGVVGTFMFPTKAVHVGQSDHAFKGMGRIIAFRLVSEAADQGSLPASPSVPTEGHGTGVVGWQPIETAPKDGTPVIGMARYADATSGFPRIVCWQDGAWREPGRSVGEALVCWAWVSRDILGDWPSEPFPRRVTVQATGFYAPPAASVSMGTSRKASEPIPPVEGVNAELLEAAKLAEDIIDDFLGHLSPDEQIACAEDPKASAALKALRAAISKATATSNSGDQG
jgi:hypothetical protein